MNKSEPIPQRKPIVVDTEETSAEWLDGIPPVFQNMSSQTSFKDVTLLVNSVISVLMNWLIIQLEMAARKMGL